MASSSPCLERLETLYIAAAIAKAKLCCPGPPWWVSSFYLCKQSLGRCEIRWNPTFHGWTVALNWTCPSSPNHKAISEYLGITRPSLQASHNAVSCPWDYWFYLAWDGVSSCFHHTGKSEMKHSQSKSIKYGTMMTLIQPFKWHRLLVGESYSQHAAPARCV